MDNRIIIKLLEDDIKRHNMCLVNGLAIDARELYRAISEAKRRPTITRVKFNDPATIVWFSDGTKVSCVCDERDYFDKEKGVLHCIAKKFMGDGEMQKVAVEWEEVEEKEHRRIIMETYTWEDVR